MANSLPSGYEFVGDFDIETEELWALLEEVARAAESSDDVIVRDSGAASLDFTATEEDISYTALGVRGPFGDLVSYVSATVDSRDDGHATVDCMVVHPDESDRDIGKAMSDEGLRQLDEQGVENVSFEIFGQIGKLLPYLIQRKGFEYDDLNDEYIRKRPSTPLDQISVTKADVPIILPENTEKEAHRPID